MARSLASWTTSGSTARDRCSVTNGAVSGSSLDRPLTRELNEKERRSGTRLIQCPIGRATVAICGGRVCRAGCLNRALPLAFGVRIRRLLILHTREIAGRNLPTPLTKMLRQPSSFLAPCRRLPAGRSQPRPKPVQADARVTAALHVRQRGSACARPCSPLTLETARAPGVGFGVTWVALRGRRRSPRRRSARRLREPRRPMLPSHTARARRRRRTLAPLGQRAWTLCLNPSFGMRVVGENTLWRTAWA